MATTKVILVFSQTTNVGRPNFTGSGREAGWSESYYYNGDLAGAIVALTGGLNLSGVRANLLPIGASIVGYHVQDVTNNVPGASISNSLSLPGTTYDQDQPQVALQLRIPASGVSNIRRPILRGIPDGQVTFGSYTPTAAFVIGMQAFMDEMKFWQMRGRDLTKPRVPIVSVDADGLFKTNGNHGLAPNMPINISRVNVTSLHAQRSMKTTVLVDGLTLTAFKTAGWSFGPGTGGKVWDDTQHFYTQTAAGTVARATTRKVGRPSDGYRGRATPRT